MRRILWIAGMFLMFTVPAFADVEAGGETGEQLVSRDETEAVAGALSAGNAKLRLDSVEANSGQFHHLTVGGHELLLDARGRVVRVGATATRRVRQRGPSRTTRAIVGLRNQVARKASWQFVANSAAVARHNAAADAKTYTDTQVGALNGRVTTVEGNLSDINTRTWLALILAAMALLASAFALYRRFFSWRPVYTARRPARP